MSLNNDTLVYSISEYKLIFYNYQTKHSVVNQIPIPLIFKGHILNSTELILVGGEGVGSLYQIIKYNYINNQVISILDFHPYINPGAMDKMPRRGFQKLSDKVMLLVLTYTMCIIDLENFQFLTIAGQGSSAIDIRTGRIYKANAKISEKKKKYLKLLFPMSKSPYWALDFSFKKFVEKHEFKYCDGFFLNDHIFFGIHSGCYSVIDMRTGKIFEKNKTNYRLLAKSAFSGNNFIYGKRFETYRMITVKYLEK